MIKLIITTSLILALGGSVWGHRDSDLSLDTEEFNQLVDEAIQHHNEDSASCELNPLPAGEADVHLDIDIPDGGCTCSGSEEEEEDLCLGEENSKKISDVLIKVLIDAQLSIYVIQDLKIMQFVYGHMTYQDWSHEIRHSNYDYVGYDKLKELVKKYRVCEKVCKVFYMFRKAIIDNANNADITKYDNGDETVTLVIEGRLLLLQDLLPELEQLLADDPSITTVTFNVITFINDALLTQDHWHGKYIFVRAVDFLLARDGFWDVTGLLDENWEPTEADGAIAFCENTYWTMEEFAFNTYPEIMLTEC